MSLINSSFSIAVQILQASSEAEFSKAKAICASEYELLNARKANPDQSIEQKLEIVFELTLYNFLNMLLAYKAKELQIPYNHNAYLDDCAKLANASKMSLNSNTKRMLRSLLSITAKILILNEQSFTTDPFTIRTSTCEILTALYDYKTLFESARDDQCHGLSADDLNDIRHCTGHLVQANTVKDHAPQSLMQEYISLIGNIFIEKLLAFREYYIDQPAHYKNCILTIDAILWRLNLHKHQKIRTILHRYVTAAQLQMRDYVSDKMYLDFRKVSVLSTLIDNTGSELLLKDQFESVIKYLMTNLEVEVKKLFFLQLFKTSRTPIADLFDDMDKDLFTGASYLLFDAQILYAHLKTLQLPNSEEVISKLNLLIHLSACLLSHATDKQELKEWAYAFFSEVKVSQLPLDWMTNITLADALCVLLCSAAAMRLSKLGAEKTRQQFIHDLNVLLERLDKKHADKYLMQRLILNVYIYLKHDLQHLPASEAHHLAHKISNSIKDTSGHLLQHFILNDMTPLESIAKKAIKYCTVIDSLANGSPESNVHALQVLQNNIYELTVQAKISDATDTLRLQLINQKMQNYIDDRRVEWAGSPCYECDDNAYYPSFDLDMNSESACSYPDEENFILNLFSIANQIDKSNADSELQLLLKIITERGTKLNEYEDEFKDLFGTEYQNSSNYHVQAYLLETDILAFLKVLIFRKQQSLQLTHSAEEAIQHTASLNELSKYNRFVGGNERSNNLDLIRSYIGLALSFMEFMDEDFELLDRDTWLVKIGKLLTTVFIASTVPLSRLNISYMKNLPLSFFMKFRQDFAIVNYPDHPAETKGQKHLLGQISAIVDKLIVMRSCVQNRLTDRDRQDPQNATAALAVRYDLNLIDLLVSSVNLSNHPTLRKRYATIPKKSITDDVLLANQHLHPLSSQLLARRADSDELPLLIVKTATKNIYECLYAYNAINTVMKEGDQTYLTLQARIIEHINFMVRDCVSLLSYKVTHRLKDGLFKYELCELKQVLNCAFYTLDQAQQTITFSTGNFYKDCNFSVTDHLVQESITLAYINEMNECSDTSIYHSMLLNEITAIEKYLDIQPHHLRKSAQAITDVYINLLTKCSSVEEYDAMLTSELHAKILAMPLFAYLVPARELLIFASRPGFDITSMSQADTDKCLSLINKFSVALLQALKTWEQAKDNDQAEPVFMCQSMYIYFRGIVTAIINHSSKENKTAMNALAAIDKHYVDYISRFSAAIDPERLTLQVVNFKPAGVVKLSFAVEMTSKPQQSKSSKKKSTPVKSEPAPRDQHDHHMLTETNFTSLRKRYHDDFRKIAQHYLKLLNHESFHIKNQPSIKFNSVMGLAESLRFIHDTALHDKLVIQLVSHTNSILQLQAPASPLQVFGDRYSDYKNWIEPYMPKEEMPERPTPALKTPVALPKRAVIATPKRRAPVPKPSVKRIEAPKPVRKLFNAFSDDIFADFRKKIALPSIFITDNESRLIRLLHAKQSHPLIAGAAVRNAIRGIPYHSMEVICSLGKAELIALLECHLHELKIKSIHPADTHLLVTFESEKHESLRIKCLNDKNVASALHQHARASTVGVEIYYCPVTCHIIDPCRLYTRIKRHVLDTAQLFDSELRVRAQFKALPELMLTAVIEEISCREQGVALECSALKSMIIANKPMLHPEFCSNRISQATFDELFIKGGANFSCLHLEYDIMLMLFPVFGRNQYDSAVIQNACKAANERYHKLIHRERYSLRVHEESNEVILLQLRLAFITDLLHAKFMSTHNLHRYGNSAEFFPHGLFGDDMTHFLERCNMPYDRSLLIELEKMWSGNVQALELRKQ